MTTFSVTIPWTCILDPRTESDCTVWIAADVEDEIADYVIDCIEIDGRYYDQTAGQYFKRLQDGLGLDFHPRALDALWDEYAECEA